MTHPPDSRPSPKRTVRRYYGLSDEERRESIQQQRNAIEKVFSLLQEYFCAEMDAELLRLDHAIQNRIIDENLQEAEDTAE